MHWQTVLLIQSCCKFFELLPFWGWIFSLPSWNLSALCGCFDIKYSGLTWWVQVLRIRNGLLSLKTYCWVLRCPGRSLTLCRRDSLKALRLLRGRVSHLSPAFQRVKAPGIWMRQFGPSSSVAEQLTEYHGMIKVSTAAELSRWALNKFRDTMKWLLL